MISEQPTKISFHMESWLENAGIVGLYRILDDEAEIQDRSLTVPVDLLVNFSDKYFNFFTKANAYGQLTRFQKVLSFKHLLKKWQETNFTDFNNDDLAKLNDWYKNVLKYLAKSNSYKKIYQLIDDDLDVLEKIKLIDGLLKKVNRKNFLKKDPELARELVGQVVEQILMLIKYFERPDSQKYFPAKTLCYTIINNAWNGVSLLNPKTKIINFYDDYQQYFVEPVKEYLAEDHTKDKFVCSTCGRPMKNQKISYGLLNGMGYDTAKKTSNAWDFNNDQFICPICRLMYSCVSAGFSYNMSKQGIFINYNRSLEELIEKNDGVYYNLIQGIKFNDVSPFRAFTTSFAEQLAGKERFELADVQVISYNDGHYNFTVIPPLAAKVIAKAVKSPFGKNNEHNLLSFLYSIGIKDFRGIKYYRIYDEVIRRLFNSTNLVSLIYEMEMLMSSQSSNIRFNQSHIMALLNINTLFLKELFREEGQEVDIKKEDLSSMRGAGVHVLKYYQKHENANKANALAYKLLQAINSSNPEKFMTILLSVYASQHQLVPSRLINTLDQPEIFKQYALAFIAGLIGKNEKGE